MTDMDSVLNEAASAAEAASNGKALDVVARREFAAGMAGLGFALIFKALKVVRPERPIHPRGTLLTGELTRVGPGQTVNPQRGQSSGVPWIDLPGKHAVTARYSRSLGLPAPLPDILGLALRLEDDGAPADVLFATTGWSWPARFALLPRRDPGKASFTTLMPYKGARGPILLGLTAESPETESTATAHAVERTGDSWVLAMHYARPSGKPTDPLPTDPLPTDQPTHRQPADRTSRRRALPRR